MIELRESTLIHAPVERVFDLSRSVEVHLLGNVHFSEQAVALPGDANGVAERTTGLIEPGERVTWRARHFGIRQRLTSHITEYRRPVNGEGFFRDVMLRGAFKSMVHDHFFSEQTEATGTATTMLDVFRFSAPLGPLGWLAERLVLRRYMRALLVERNRAIKQVAESGEWRKYVPR